MANLYGILDGDRAKTYATRISNQEIASFLEDWNGRVTTELDKAGNFRVYVGNKGGGGKRLLYDGNIGMELSK